MFDDPSQPSFNTSTKAGMYEQGWAQSTTGPTDKTNSDSAIGQHNNGMGEFVINVAKAANTNYAKWVGSSSTAPASTMSATASATSAWSNATSAAMTSVAATSTTSTAPTSISGVPVPSATSYDYVIVGGGAAGIPMADRLSEAGHSVLLIEKGVASSARWGGSEYPKDRFELKLKFV